MPPAFRFLIRFSLCGALLSGQTPVPLFTLPALDDHQPVSFQRAGVHRQIPFQENELWESRVLPGGATVWRTSIRSPRAAYLRIHLAACETSGGRIVVSSPSGGSESEGHLPESQQGYWSGVVFSDTILVTYHSVNGGKPCHIDKISHGFASETEPEQIMGVAVPASAKLYGEREDSSFTCHGWIARGGAAQPAPMLLTSGNCLITQPEADSAAVVWTRPEQCGNAAEAGQQTVGAVLLVAFPHPLQGFSLLRLSSPGQIAQPAEASQAGFCNIAVDEALRKSADAYAQISLFWKEDPARSAPGGCQTQSIQPSAGIAGALTTGDCVVEGAFYADRYTFTAPAKAQTSISVSSTAFDSYVLLYAPDGSLLAANDDGGVGFNARIPPVGRLTLPSSGTYTVEVSSFKPFEVGAYNVFQELSGAPLGPYRFVPVTPCRVMDTRAEGGMSGLFGPPFLARNTTRVIPLTGKCDIPADATGYSLNITAVPRGPLGFLTAFPAGLRQPPVSTLNSMDGRIAANAALIPAGENGAISLFVSNDTDVVLDVNGFFTR